MFPRLVGAALAALMLFVAGCDVALTSDTPSSTAVSSPFVPSPESNALVPDAYIVTLAAEPEASRREAVLEEVTAEIATRGTATLRAAYRHALTGFTATMSAAEAEALRADPRVASVEQDRWVSPAGGGSQPSPTWGLDRVNQRVGQDGLYTWRTSGEGVTAYVVDTGIRITHQEFGGRARSGYDFYDNDPDAEDCHGHGTQVAGTLGGSAFGVAKDVALVAVRVLGCDGFGRNGSLLAGLDWVAANHTAPAVVNVSLQAYASPALDAAVQSLIDAGVTVVAAAGNSYGDACPWSPGRVRDALTVGAADASDTRADFSNFGPCVDFFAPGVDVRSASSQGDRAVAVSSGTSLAAPHAAGAAALYLEHDPAAAPRRVHAALAASATKDAVHDARSPNDHLLYTLLGRIPPGGSGDDAVTLVATPSRQQREVHVRLDWEGARGDAVDVYRNGRVRRGEANDGWGVDTLSVAALIRLGEPLVYQVCEEGPSAACSDEVIVRR